MTRAPLDRPRRSQQVRQRRLLRKRRPSRRIGSWCGVHVAGLHRADRYSQAKMNEEGLGVLDWWRSAEGTDEAEAMAED
jgi:hypothetical protein